MTLLHRVLESLLEEPDPLKNRIEMLLMRHADTFRLVLRSEDLEGQDVRIQEWLNREGFTVESHYSGNDYVGLCVRWGFETSAQKDRYSNQEMEDPYDPRR